MNPCPPVKQQSSHGEGSCLIERVWEPDLPNVRAGIPQTGADLSGPPPQPMPPISIAEVALACVVVICVIALVLWGASRRTP